jgi:hypothetical protein
MKTLLSTLVFLFLALPVITQDAPDAVPPATAIGLIDDTGCIKAS